MKKVFLFSVMLMAAASMSAQVVLWNGEDETITSRNANGGWWDRGNPSVVDNPEKDGINPSSKCLKFTMTGNDFGQKHLALPFRDWITPDLKGNRRFSFMIKKAVNENVKVEVSDPTNGVDNYWEKTAAWYGGDGKWQKVVLDFSTNTNMNDFPGVFAIEAQTASVDEPQDVFVDNVVIEAMPMVGETALKDVTDNSLTGSIKVTGSLMRGDCQNANGDWFRVEYDDFALLKDKMSTEATELDVRGVTLTDAYWDQILEKCPVLTIRLDDGDLTAIAPISIQTASQEAVIYSLSGIRCTKTDAKGFYIINGKKTIIK
ncbi:MAG: hypothetical protein IJP70_07450 [Bacteroidales bacterium]|nr:hypothetical protein [Bacteroidales bacterium]